MTPKRKESEAATRPADLSETDLAEDKTGKNAMQGDDQQQVHNERHAVADEKRGTDDIAEGLDKLDKDVRAKRDLGKGKRFGPKHAYNADDEETGSV